MKYYIGLGINGGLRYLKYSAGSCYALTNNVQKATEFTSEKQAKKAISDITGAYALLKPYLRVIASDEKPIKLLANAKPKNVCPQHKFSDADYHADQIQAEYDELTKQLEECDAECMDIAHYMEFRELDVQRGYKAYKMMHDARLRRRKVKDEMLLLDNIKKMIATTEEALEKRKYVPRVRKDIQYTKGK